jgi:HEAT repeat protein
MCVPRSWLCLIVLIASLSRAEPPEPPTAESLIESLRSGDFAERERALDALSETRTVSEPLIETLRERLEDEDETSRQHAAMALAALGLGGQRVIDELLAGMGRRSAATYLSQPEKARTSMAAIAKLGADAVPSLVRAIEDEAYVGK